jgi:hypothetical protein
MSHKSVLQPLNDYSIPPASGTHLGLIEIDDAGVGLWARFSLVSNGHGVIP